MRYFREQKPGEAYSMWALLLELGIAGVLVFIAWRVWPKETPTNPPKEPRNDE